jgi:hypothetical protein
VIINEVYQGEAVQSKVLSLPGMPGYDPEAPFYSKDLEKSAEEFKLADVDKDGIPAGEDPDDIWELGFRHPDALTTLATPPPDHGRNHQANLSK